MQFNCEEWIGSWENFERYFLDTSASMQKTWQEAEEAVQAKKKNLIEKILFRNGVKRFWQGACYTANKENPHQLGGWCVRPYGQEKMQITWYALDQKDLGTYIYTLDKIVKNGLEGKACYLFRAEDGPEGCAFMYLLSMEPMPSRTEKLRGGLISHLHFQYASKKETLIDTKDRLKQKHWYATMCDADATQTERCNIVRAMHKLPLWEEPVNG